VNLDVTLGAARLEHGTTVTVAVPAAGRDTTARVSWLGGPFHQLRCAAPLPVAPGARIAVDGHPGVVLDPDAPRHGPGNDLLVELTRRARQLA
jgi:hypothetical protein